MAEILFYLLSTVCIGAVIGMILSRNQAYGALFLVLAFAALGGLFGLIGAPFVAVIQILVYAGAIMVLFIFVLMTINVRTGFPPERKKWTVGAAVFLAGLLLAEIYLAARGFLSASPSEASAESVKAVDIGKLLFSKYLYPFEITSILIMAALVGAVVLTKKKDTP
jgi:NADH-quinone oxidoreductase subunit J